MRTGTALVAVGAAGITLGAANLWLRVRHHREIKHLTFVRLHGELSAETAKDSVLGKTWYAELEPEDAARMLTRNRWVSLWSVMLRQGFHSREATRRALAFFMSDEGNRRYWEIVRDYRRSDARDAYDVTFNELATDAYIEAFTTS